MILGVAGHVGHGKTTLVRELTGIDPQREEDRKFGRTINLGFTSLQTDSGVISLIDVPGHENYLANMLTGASSFHAAVLLVAADEGIKPQTLEHLRILLGFQVSSLSVILTKTDLVRAEILIQRSQEIRRMLTSVLDKLSPAEQLCKSIPVIPLSSVNKSGFDRLRDWINVIARESTVCCEQSAEPVRLSIDRAFQKQGFGWIVTGTLLRGTLNKNNSLHHFPVDQTVRMKSIQQHGQVVEVAKPRERVACNLSGLNSPPMRGHELIQKGDIRPTIKSGVLLGPIFDQNSLRHNQVVQLHTATTKIATRVLLRGSQQSTVRPALLKFEREILVEPGQRCLLRSSDGRSTLAGGFFLATEITQEWSVRKTLAFLQDLSPAMEEKNVTTSLRIWLRLIGTVPIDLKTVRQNLPYTAEELSRAMAVLLDQGQSQLIESARLYVTEDYLNEFRSRILTQFHRLQEENSPTLTFDQLASQLSQQNEIGLLKYVINQLVTNGQLCEQNGEVGLSEQLRPPSARFQAVYRRMMNSYVDNKSGPTLSELAHQLELSERETSRNLKRAVAAGELVEIGQGFYYTPEMLNLLWKKLTDKFATHSAITVAEIRDEWKLTRKHAIPLLEYFDDLGLTIRKQGVREKGPTYRVGEVIKQL